MDLVFVDQGLQNTLLAIATDRAGGLIWQIITNDVDPDQNTVLADLVFDVGTWGAWQLTDTNFLVTQLAAHKCYISAPTILFVNASGVSADAWGYAITSADGLVLIAATLFAGAPVSVAPGDSISVLPILGDFSEKPTVGIAIIDAGTF